MWNDVVCFVSESTILAETQNADHIKAQLTGTSVPKILLRIGGASALVVEMVSWESTNNASSKAFFIRSPFPSEPTRKATAEDRMLTNWTRASVMVESFIVCVDGVDCLPRF
jgi:hypothetical protein